MTSSSKTIDKNHYYFTLIQSRRLRDLTPKDTSLPKTERYPYRSFDRQWIIADSRVGDRFRPDLWRTHSERQVYLSRLFSQALGTGPALTATALIPDLDHFRGSFGAKAVIPLYRTPDVKEATLASYPKQEKLLKALIAGACFRADELPKVPEPMRKPPRQNKLGKGLFG